MKPTALLLELKEYAAKHSVPILRPECEQILLSLVRQRRPNRLLEVGTAIGYSTLLLASAMPETATLCTLEIDPARAAIAERQVEVAGMQRRVSIIIGNAMATIPPLEGNFDFVFLDGPKAQYLAYLELMLDKLAPGALVVADNVLFRGMVSSASETPRRYRTIVKRLKQYLDFVENDARFSTTLIPDGDGVAISYFNGDEHEN